MALYYPDRLESNNPAAYGIVRAIEVAGHKTVSTVNDLYSLEDSILSDSGTNEDDDALGQKWYVVSAEKEYQLIDWSNRKSSSGWQEVNLELEQTNEVVISDSEPEDADIWIDTSTSSSGSSGNSFIISTSVSKIEVVNELPESPDDNTLYLIVSE